MECKNNRIAIIGSSSFIAKNLIERFENDNVIAAFNRDHSNEIQKYLSDFEPNVIINCAAEIYNDDKMFDSNIILLFNILDYAKKRSFDLTKSQLKVIQIGSSSEYGNYYTVPLSENMKLAPSDMYQATKGAGTLLCQGYARSYNIPICIVRPFTVYGKYEKPHKFLPTLWRTFKHNVPMTVYNGFHDFVYIDDFTQAIETLINKSITLGDIINVGSGKQYSNYEIVDIFKNITGIEPNIDVKYSTIRKFDRKTWVCDPTHAIERYGIECTISIERGIKLFLETASY